MKRQPMLNELAAAREINALIDDFTVDVEELRPRVESIAAKHGTDAMDMIGLALVLHEHEVVRIDSVQIDGRDVEPIGADSVMRAVQPGTVDMSR